MQDAKQKSQDAMVKVMKMHSILLQMLLNLPTIITALHDVLYSSTIAREMVWEDQ